MDLIPVVLQSTWRLAPSSAAPAEDSSFAGVPVTRSRALPAAPAGPAAGLVATVALARRRSLRRGLKALPQEDQSEGDGSGDAVIDDVEYVFVSGDEEKGDAVSADVLERVNMVSRAHQGLYKAPEGVPDTEQGVGALTGALMSFPSEQQWQVVGKTQTDADRESFLFSVREAVSQHTGDLEQDAMQVQTRMGGRYTSVRVRQQVWCVEQISRVLESLKSLPEVVMAF
mmetsp:Transcript_31121/g.58379  ORF Transcript_31121/g.58379 Transcript_31121/m.58379 type:complete len:228 (+) Transcript_31121:65-748(+)